MAQKNSADLLRAYLIVGSDELKRTAALNKLRTYVPDEWTDFCIDELDATTLTEPSQLIDSLLALPFGSDIRLVILHNVGALTKDYSEPLIDYLKEPNEQTVLCCEGPELAKNTRLYKALAKVGPKAVIECGTLKPWELPAYVEKLAAKQGISIQGDAAKELVNRLGENTVALENQLKTLSELHPGELIDKQMVATEVAQIAEIKPWTFCDTLCERNPSEALKLLHLMRSPDYIRLHIAITSRLRELICAKTLESRGQSRLLATELGVQQWQIKNHARWARNFSMEELTHLLDASETCEAQLKSSPDSETAFITYILKFAK